MLDTVKFRLEPSPFPLESPSGDWELSRGTRAQDGEVKRWTLLHHKASDLRLFGYDEVCSTLEVSLPNLLNGNNGILLRPHEVNTAYYAAVDLAGQVLQRVFPEKLTRADIVHHFEGYAFEFVAALRGLSHTAVRKKQVEYFESGLEWPGKNLHIRLYDKNAELNGRPGLIQRLEIQLRNHKLDRIVWSQRSGFNVESLYSYYREICNGFQSRRLPKLGSIEEFFYWLKLHDTKVEGTCPVDRFLSYRSKRTRYRIQKVLNEVSLSFFDASFIPHLPENINDLTFLDCPKEAKPLAPAGPACGGGARAA